jgi:SAM-dependent methyltransferase
MSGDIRAAAAPYYDLNPTIPDDVAFYKALLPSADAAVLELGCGTGRVLLPLAESCGFLQGLDASEGMLAICHLKLQAAAIPPTKVRVEAGDITNFHLGRTFDLIIAPYRVFQLLETDAQVEGLFRCVRTHLAPGGSCILNVFRPELNAERLRQTWCQPDELLSWETTVAGDEVRCYERRPRMDRERLILYPELIYRRYRRGVLVEEAVLKIPRTCYSPEAFEQVITRHDFHIIQRWGGYAGEAYGEGPELVVQFTIRD